LPDFLQPRENTGSDSPWWKKAIKWITDNVEVSDLVGIASSIGSLLMVPKLNIKETRYVVVENNRTAIEQTLDCINKFDPR
jgi:hypothetical protein